MNKPLYLFPFVFVGILMLTLVPIIKTESLPKKMIVFDAGSSATRVYIFNVNSKTSLGKESKLKVIPGISNYAGKSYDEVDNYLNPLFDFINLNVNILDMKEIPVYFLATAGLRLIDQVQSNTLLGYIDKRLKLTDFVYERDHLKIMEGSEEGLSLWLSVNHLYKTLDDSKQTFVGVHDLGGASTQIVFSPQKSGETTLRYNGETYNLYEHSYLGYGMNSARDLFEKKLDMIDENGNVINPCLPKDYKRFSEKLQKNMIGTSDPSLCSSIISSIFDKNCTKTSCGFNDVFQPPLNGNFISRGSNVESTAKFLGIKFSKATPKKMSDAAQNLCSLDLNKYIKTYNNTPENFCFQAFYLSSIWSIGFGFDVNQNVVIADKIDGYDVSWALGFSLLKLDNYPKQNFVQTVDGSGVFYLLFSLGGVSVIASVIMLSIYFRRSSYTSI